MDLAQLKQLVVIAEEKVLSHAAEKLYISQPSLSRSVQNLEEEFGVKLFDRKKNSMVLNEAGILAVKYARIVLQDTENLKKKIEAFSKQLQSLKIVTCAPAPLWKFTAEAAKRFPRLRVTSDMPDEDLLETLLLGERADIAILRKDAQSEKIESVPFLSEHLCVQIPNTNPLSQKEKIQFRDLEGQTIRVYTKIGFWDKVHRENIPNARFIESDDFMIYMNLVNAMDSLVFVTSLGNTLHPERTGCKTLPLQDKAARVVYRIACLKKNRENLEEVVSWAVSAAGQW
ncbi:MAG: LysR family transcriptional regulator [Treponema sp.]|jgi:DNA-binding transcriptional LysR family regulator|nr:LysR family transcriptional regulator [Treponema sp.]